MCFSSDKFIGMKYTDVDNLFQSELDTIPYYIYIYIC